MALMLSQRKGDSVTIRLGAPRVSRWLGQPLRAAIRVHVSSADVRMVMREAEKTIIPFPVERPKELLELQPNAKACIRRSLTVAPREPLLADFSWRNNQ